MPQNPARWSQNIGFGWLQEGVEKGAESEEEREILIQMFVDSPTRRRQIVQKRLAMRMETHKMVRYEARYRRGLGTSHSETEKSVYASESIKTEVEF